MPTLRSRLLVTQIKKELAPRVYQLIAESENSKLKISLDLPLKLRDITGLNEGQNLEFVISDKEIENVADNDLYMRGRVLISTRTKNFEEVLISIGGLILRLENHEKVPLGLGENALVYIKIRRLS